MASIPYDKFPVLPTIDTLSIAPATSRIAAERDSLFQTHLRRDENIKPPAAPAKENPPKSPESKPAAENRNSAGTTEKSREVHREKAAESASNNNEVPEKDATEAAENTSETDAAPAEKEEKTSEEPATEGEFENATDGQVAHIVADVDEVLTSQAKSVLPAGEVVAETEKVNERSANETKAKESLRIDLDAAAEQKHNRVQRADDQTSDENAPAARTVHAATQSAEAPVEVEVDLNGDGKEQTAGERKAKSRLEASQVTDAAVRKSESVAAASVAEASGEATSPETAPTRENSNSQPNTQTAHATSNSGGSETAAAPTSRLPQHLVGRGTERTAASPALNEADQSRFVQRVARAFQAAQNRDGEIRLRLSPPELGSLRLEVKVQGGALTARIEAETTAARQLLLDNLPVLRERLAEQGVRVEQFDVDLTDRQPGGLPDGPANEQHRDAQTGASLTRTQSRESEVTENTNDQPTTRRKQHDGRLNVVV